MATGTTERLRDLLLAQSVAICMAALALPIPLFGLHCLKIADQIRFYNALPSGSSIQGTFSFYVQAGVSKSLGLGIAPNDGSIGIGTSIPTGNIIGVCLREITHARGGNRPRLPGRSAGLALPGLGYRVVERQGFRPILLMAGSLN
jgi:hypothetical protein